MSSYDAPNPFDMDRVQLKLFLSLLPKIPHITRVALLHILRVSQHSKYVDLRTEVLIALIRAFIAPSHPRSISSTQKLLTKDPGIKGRIWVSTYTTPAPPEHGVRDAIEKVIKSLADSTSTKKSEFRLDLPEVVPIEAEWTGYRAGATRESKLPPISEKEKYVEMMKECKSPTTVLYFHGGAYFVLDPATHRATTKKLAKMTGGRCFSVRYRLAPKHPFPAALTDALLCYLSLLYPPPDAYHEPVKPEHIVLAGDSAGGNLSLALLQTLLELVRQNAKISWFGSDRAIPLPAGVAVASPWLDFTHSSASCNANAQFDYLPAFNSLYSVKRPACALWPADPPRAHLYVADDLVCHPLVTLLLARSWAGSPPLYVSTGWELLADEDKYAAWAFHRDGVPVVFEEYEAMPHCFAMIFQDLPESRRCFAGWAGFVRDVVEKQEEVVKAGSRFTLVKARSLKEVELDPAKVTPYSEEEMRERIAKRAALEVMTADGAAKL